MLKRRLFVGLSLVAVTAALVGFNVSKEKQLDTVNAADTFTLKNLADIFETKQSNYPISDEFIEKYQQTSGGYIQYAKKQGKTVNKFLHLPDQKWHFFDSWIGQSVDEDPTFLDSLAKTRINALQCPELLLWIYEAAGVNPTKVRNAEKAAEAGKVSGSSTATIAKNMRAIVSWDDIYNSLGI